MSDTNELRGSATACGYHYLNLFQCCQWKWHLRYNRNIIPQKVSRYLVFGQVMHIVFEMFYGEHVAAPRDRDALCELFRFELSRRRELYAKDAEYVDDAERGPVMVAKWYDTFGARDFDTYDILAVEQTMLFELPGGYMMSVKPDVVVAERSSGRVLSLEHKTTSRSASEMAARVACEAQVDAQIMGINAWLRAQGDTAECSGVVPDVLYKRMSVCTATRDTTVIRSRKELADAALSFAGVFADIAQKRVAYESGVVPELLYSHNGAWCGNFSCEYAAVCHSRFEGAPPGYMLDASGDLSGTVNA
jgi:hypothetical protein